MKANADIAGIMAGHLLQVKAVRLSPEEPFTWASGIKSPIYCDNRVTLSYPAIRNFIRQQFVNFIREEFGVVDLIVGVATGGIAQGVLVAQDLGLPFAYVRSSAKQHGMTNKIEGHVKEGQSVVVVEDLVSTGKSSLNAVTALHDAGCIVKGMVAIFTYNLEEARRNFEEQKCRLITLSDYNTLVDKAIENEYIKENELRTLLEWRENPKEWRK